jgi:GH25 family lysozyme M1 (1,4-beta-N-acetylmuramidase)
LAVAAASTVLTTMGAGVALATPALAGTALPDSTAAVAAPAVAGVPGLDVSGGQSVTWTSVYNAGYRFALVSAADGTAQNPVFRQQYDGAAAAGLLRGAYFFAEPVFETGTTHADWFINQIGYVNDGMSLPPVLDVEQNPNQAGCDGLPAATWVSYVQQFVAEVKARTGATAIIYTNPDTWTSCLAGNTGFHANPLWIAHWGVSTPTIPGGWPTYTFWQYAGGTVPGVTGQADLDTFNGTLAGLKQLAAGSTTPPSGTPYQVTGADASGLAIQSQPHVNHVIRYVPNGTTLYVTCQTRYGDQVNGATQYGLPFTTWDQLTDGTWVYDWYMNTPTVATDGYSPGIAHCAGG